MRPIVWILFWFIYFPLLRLLMLLLFWHRRLEDRERFEKRNKFERLALSFKEDGEKADLCFQFSSEGEYQQVAPLITDALKKGLKLELVFFSPSVEKAIMKLAGTHSKQIRYLRFPLVRLFPFIDRRCFSAWVTARTLIMVRYDLFPELLLWGMNPGHKLKIVWMSFKKERSRGKDISFWKKLFLKHSKAVVFATESDLRLGESFSKDGRIYDFRIEQIQRRVLEKEKKFREVFPAYPDLRAHLEKCPKKLIIGNAWVSDLFLLRDVPKDVFLLVVPHQLSLENLNAFHAALKDLGREAHVFSDQNAFVPGNTVILNKKGVLCELYADFPKCYVGGGFEGSIHSVLEPLVAGNGDIACGPQHFRSTEYDVAMEMGRISEVTTPEKFLSWMNHTGKSSDHARMKELISGYESMREFVLSC